MHYYNIVYISNIGFDFFVSVVGVCLMVGLLFFLMVWVELAMDWLGSKMKRSKKEPDPEDPAALVGSFKRYKN